MKLEPTLTYWRYVAQLVEREADWTFAGREEENRRLAEKSALITPVCARLEMVQTTASGKAIYHHDNQC